jgi:hypothetical protein
MYWSGRQDRSVSTTAVWGAPVLVLDNGNGIEVVELSVGTLGG